jgi:hypothetical protein
MNDIRNAKAPEKPKKPAAKKKLKEDTTTAVDVRGLGYITGDPAVDSSVTTNDVDSNFFRGGLTSSIKKSDNPLAARIGFKSFNPNMISRDKTLQYWDTDENGDPLKGRKKK